jgi:DNA-binding CsgD family transcriptional regulator
LDDFEEILHEVNEFETLRNLHNDIWEDTLLEPPFLFFYQRVLHPRERQIVDSKIKGKTNSEIATEMGVTVTTVARSIYNIRYIFRNKARQRVNKFWNMGRLYTKRNTLNWRRQG